MATNRSKFIRDHLKIRHLNVLIALEDTLNVSQAASRLHVTQAAVSRTLAEEERGQGLRIFDRHPRGLSKTALGDGIMHAARQVIADLHNLETVAVEHGAALRGEINTGLQTVTALDAVAQVLVAFKETHPLVNIRVTEGLMPELIEQLRSRRLELVYCRMQSDLGELGLAGEVITSARIVLVARVPDDGAELAELLKRPWLLPLVGTPMRNEFRRVLAQHGLEKPLDRIETNNPLVINQILSKSDRIALVPDKIAEMWRRDSNVRGHLPA